MNKIFNWTFGSVFRTFGRFFAYLLLGTLLGLFMQKNGLKFTDLLGIDRIYASEKTLDLKNYYVRIEERHIANTYWTAAIPMGTNFDIDMSNTFLNALRGRVGSSQKFQAGVRYRVKFNVAISNINNFPDLYDKMDVKNLACAGSLTNSWESNSDLIESCQFVGKTLYNNNERAHFYFDIVPKTEIYGFQINFYFKSANINYLYGPYIKNIQITSAPSVSYDDTEINAINNQTDTLIINNNQNTQDIINNQTELLSSKCTNLLNPTLKTSYTHRGITFAPNINNGTVNYYEVYGIRTSAQNAWAVIGYLDIKKGTNVKVYTSDPHVYIQFWNTSNNTGIPNSAGTVNNTYTFTQNYNNVEIAVWTDKQTIDYATIYVMITESNDTNYCMYGSNISKFDEQTQAINDLKDSITDSSGPSLSGLSNDTTAGWLPAGPLDSVLNLPLTLINSLINGMSGSCAPLRVPLPYVNLDLPIPCMSSLYTQMGFGTFFNWVGNIAAAFILFTYLLNLYKYVDDTLTFRENNFIDNWSGV